jgi:hypothetical protein
MDPWFAPNIHPLLYLDKPVYYIPVTEIIKTEDGAVLVARQGQKDVARIPLFCVSEATDSARQLQLECRSAMVVFTKMAGSPRASALT